MMIPEQNPSYTPKGHWPSTETLEVKNKAAQNPSTIAKAEVFIPIEDTTEFLRRYEVGEDMGKAWYTTRIMDLVDQNNHLTGLLDTHNIPHLNTRK
jgi:hypothetical protein